MFGILRQVQGWVKLKGNTDGTKIGNTGSSLNVDVKASALPSGASTAANQTTGNASLSSIDSKVSTAANQTTLLSRVGTLTETAPATDTASSGLNGRLQRIAQRISSLITTVTTGTGILSTIRGNTDGTLIGNVSDAIKVFDASNQIGMLTTFKSSTDVTLVTAYTTLHSVSGSGVFFGATFVVDNNNVDCRIQIDGQTVFEFNGDFLSEVVNKDASFKASGIFEVTNDGKRLFFTPQTPLRYTTSLNFAAKLNGKKVKYQLYTYSVV
jgi:hypothetical protein